MIPSAQRRARFATASVHSRASRNPEGHNAKHSALTLHPRLRGALAERADVTKLTQAQVPDAEACASEIMLLLEGYDGLILIHGQRR